LNPEKHAVGSGIPQGICVEQKWELQSQPFTTVFSGYLSRGGGDTRMNEEIRLEIEELEERIAPDSNGSNGYEGQPGNQGNGSNGYEGQPGNQGGH